MQPFENIKNWYKNLPDKKRWIDVVTALLTVPVLLTVIISNVLTIQKKKNDESLSPPPATQAPITVTIEDLNGNTSPTPESTDNTLPTPQCKQDLPEVEIVSPQEDEVVSSDPVCVVFLINGSNYCPLSWSYRINGSSWSPSTNQPVCLYNMKDGDIEFQLRAKSENGEEQILTHSFVYKKDSEASDSADAPQL